jgi:hypothetical protein
MRSMDFGRQSVLHSLRHCRQAFCFLVTRNDKTVRLMSQFSCLLVSAALRTRWRPSLKLTNILDTKFQLLITLGEGRWQNKKWVFLFAWGPTPPLPVGQDLFIHEVSNHTQRCTTVGRTPLDEWSALAETFYLKTYDTHNRHPYPRWDSNPQSQQASSRGRTS